MSCTTVTTKYSQCIWETIKLPNINVNVKIFNNDVSLYYQKMNWKCDENENILPNIFMTRRNIFEKQDGMGE